MSNVQNPTAEPTQTSVLTETLLQPLGVADAVRGASQNVGEFWVWFQRCLPTCVTARHPATNPKPSFVANYREIPLCFHSGVLENGG